jgi:hypothetical protein
MTFQGDSLVIVTPLTLEGSFVRLEPLQREHASYSGKPPKTHSTIFSNGSLIG